MGLAGRPPVPRAILVVGASKPVSRSWESIRQFAFGVMEYGNQTYKDATEEVLAEYLGKFGKLHNLR